MKINELVKEYAAILKWDGESVMDLYDHIVRLTKAAPTLFALPLPYLLKLFVHRVNMRFDLSRLNGDILTVDKHGGRQGRSTVEQLRALVFADHEIIRQLLFRPETLQERQFARLIHGSALVLSVVAGEPKYHQPIIR